jgi:hypothetical protein
VRRSLTNLLGAASLAVAGLDPDELAALERTLERILARFPRR